MLLLWLENLRPDLEAWLTEQPDTVAPRARLLLAVGAGLAVAPLILLAAYFWSLGRRTLGAGRFPPPSMKVLRDTAVLVGPAAEARGRLLQALAVFWVILACGLVGALWWLDALLQPGTGS